MTPQPPLPPRPARRRPRRVVGLASVLLLAAPAVASASPVASLAPASHDFGVQSLTAAPVSRTVTVTNTGDTTLSTGAVALEGAGAAAFALGEDHCSNQAVAPAASCTVTVSFAPTVAGWRTALLRVPGDATVPSAVARLSGRAKGTGADDAPLTAPTFAELPLVRAVGDGGDTVSSVASGSCDIDGDGVDDLIAGASLWSREPTTNSWEGAAYVTFGRRDLGGEDLGRAPAQRVLRIEGEQVKAQAATSVACLGDVNGDGIDDLGIGAWAYAYPGRTGSGAATGLAYVVFGAKDIADAGPIGLDHLGDRGFRIEGSNRPEDDHLGYDIAGLGDVDGDGLADIAVMANTGDTTDATPPRANNSIVHVLRGQRGTATIDVSQPGTSLLRIDGASPESSASPFGMMNDIAAAGDVDGDGIGDLIVGTYTAVFRGRSTASGAAFVISGARRGRVDLAAPASSIMTVGGAFAGHRLGIGVASAGDVNGDGIDDVAIGADSTSAANSDAAYVVYGRRGGSGEVLDTAALGTRGYRILGAPGSSTGYGLDGIGDVDGDGLADLALGSYADRVGDPATGLRGGAVRIVHGIKDPTTLPTGASSALVPANPADTTRTLSLATLTPAQGSRLDGSTGVPAGTTTPALDRLGRTVAFVGDVDGNGARDVAFGSDLALRLGRTRSGEVAVALLPGPVPAAPVDPDPPVDPKPPVDPGTPAGGAVPLPALPAPAIAAIPAPGTTPLVRRHSLRSAVGGSLVARGGRVAVTLRNDGTVTTRGRVWIRARVGGRPVSIARATAVTLPAGGRRIVRLRLTPAATLLLRHAGRVRVTVTVAPFASNSTVPDVRSATVRKA